MSQQAPSLPQGAEETDVEDNADEHNTEEKDNWHHASLSSGLIYPHLADSSHVPHPQQDGEQEYWQEEEETVAGDGKREEREASYLSDDAYSQDAWWTEEIEMGSQFDENELVDGGVIHYQYAYEDDDYEEEEEEEHYGEYIMYEEGDEVDREGTEALNDDEITQYLEHYAETAESEDVYQPSLVEEKEAEKKMIDATQADNAEEEDDFDGDEESEFGDEEELEDIDIDAELFTELTEEDGDVDLHDTGAFTLPFGDDLHILAA